MQTRPQGDSRLSAAEKPPHSPSTAIVTHDPRASAELRTLGKTQTGVKNGKRRRPELSPRIQCFIGLLEPCRAGKNHPELVGPESDHAEKNDCHVHVRVHWGGGAALTLALASSSWFPTANAVVAEAVHPDLAVIPGVCPEGFFCADVIRIPCCKMRLGCECQDWGRCSGIELPLGTPPPWARHASWGTCVKALELVECCDFRTCTLPPCPLSDCQSCGCVQGGSGWTMTRPRLRLGGTCNSPVAAR